MNSLSYDEKRRKLVDEIKNAGTSAVGLAKDTSNLFRDRVEVPKRRLDVRHFNRVLGVHADEGWVEAEGMTPFWDLVAGTLPHGVMPAVVPELRSITIGGAVSGVGIESSSFRHGLVHEGVLSMEVLTGDGRILECTPDNEYSDLFFGIPNSYGTLGYVLKVRSMAVPVQPYVRLNHIRFVDPHRLFEAMGRWCAGDEADFVDGTVFSRDEMYLTIGRFSDEAPYTSDYTYEKIYYRSIRERSEDFLTVRDYIWRWDTDWFWCSKNLGMQNPLLRRLVGSKRLNSVAYTKVMRWNSRHRFTERVNRLLGIHTESVIQDVDVPIDRACEFLDFFHDQIGILPVWLCPVRARRPDVRFPLFPVRADTLYVNFGFWDVIRGREKKPDGHYNRLVENKVAELGGIKSLYSSSYFTPDAFWQQYNRGAYEALKARYDSSGRLMDLYDKCVLRK
jgi:FAD/FMN-containing dehydrogenase